MNNWYTYAAMLSLEMTFNYLQCIIINNSLLLYEYNITYWKNMLLNCVLDLVKR